MAEQHDVAQILILDHLQDILDVGFEIEVLVRQMRALAEAGVGWRQQPMPRGQHQRVHLSPSEAAAPRAVTEQEGFGGDESLRL